MKRTRTASIAAIVILTLAPTFAKANSGDFSGGVAIGSSYAGVDTTPTNGLIVQGNVGIGTTSPGFPLQVNLATDGAPVLKVVSPSQNAGFWEDSTKTTIGTWSSTPLGFFTGGADRITITSGGSVGIATTSPSYTLHVNGSVAGTSAYVNLSDIRHKKNIKPLNIGLKEIQQLRPVIFEWKAPKDHGMEGHQIGFVAQEVEKVLPSVVVTENNDEKTKGMKYTEIIPVLTKAIQELHYLIEDQNSLFEEQKKMMAKQQTEIDELKQTIVHLTPQK